MVLDAVLFVTMPNNVYKQKIQLLSILGISAIGLSSRVVFKLVQLDKSTKAAQVPVMNKEPATMLLMVFPTLLAVATKKQ